MLGPYLKILSLHYSYPRDLLCSLVRKYYGWIVRDFVSICMTALYDQTTASVYPFGGERPWDGTPRVGLTRAVGLKRSDLRQADLSRGGGLRNIYWSLRGGGNDRRIPGPGEYYNPVRILRGYGDSDRTRQATGIASTA